MNTVEEAVRPVVLKPLVDKQAPVNKQAPMNPPVLKNVRIEDTDVSFTDELSKNFTTSLALSDLISFDTSLVEPIEVHTLSLGAQLREARNRIGVTIEAIARNTCISRHFLHALEQNQWDALPPIVYCRGYIRLYAKCVGVNPELWLGQLEIELEGHAVQSELKKRTDAKRPIGLPSPLNTESTNFYKISGVSKEWFWRGLALTLGLIVVFGAWLWPQSPGLELPASEHTQNAKITAKPSELLQNTPEKMRLLKG